MEAREARASVSPPRWGVVAGLMPSSERVGGAKEWEGPERDVYDLSGFERSMELKSGVGSGGECVKERVKGPGSGRLVGAGRGRGISGRDFAAYK